MTTRGKRLPEAELRRLRLEIEHFNAEYAHVLDEGDLAAWPDFFVDDAVYRITGRENADAGLPLGLIYCDGKGMLRDRARAVLKTTMHAPRYLRHYCSNLRITGLEPDGGVQARANYLVVETLMEDESRILQAGRYEDVFVRRDGRLLIKERHCVYDTLTIPNALIYPV